MVTKYICTTCQTRFEDHDPVAFGSLPPSYPPCPNGVEEALRLFDKDNNSGEFWQGAVVFSNPKMQAMSYASRQHKVDIQASEIVVTPQPTVTPPKPLSFADKLKQGLTGPPPPIEKSLGPVYKVKTAQERAQDLIQWADKCTRSSVWGTSAKYPKDRLHPKSGEVYETIEVIRLASDIWNGRKGLGLNHHAMLPQFKDDWRGRIEVDFICDIEKGKEGRHIIHVIVGVKGEGGVWIAT